LPIFKNFVKEAIKKEEARPFKVADNILMMVIDPITGQKAKFQSKTTIIESYKMNYVEKKNISNIHIKNRIKNNNILKFY
jgi:penicillin-binding protein 1A